MLYFVPQFPTVNRYPSEWINWFPKVFDEWDLDWCISAPIIYERTEKQSYDTFSSLYNCSVWELEQCKELLDYVQPNDTVFFADLDYPGFSATCAQLLRRMYGDKVKLYGYMHAGSYCKGDYFEPIRYSKWDSEQAMFHTIDGIFVGSEYHKQKLVFNLTPHFYPLDEDKNKVHDVGVPYYPQKIKYRSYRMWDVAYTSRIDSQKTDKYLLSLAKKMPDIKFVTTSIPSKPLPNITLAPVENRQQYHDILQNSKCVFVPIAESTFGYNVLEALDYGCIPICPNGFSYPEFVPKKYLYSTKWRVGRVAKQIESFIYKEEIIDFDFSPYQDCIRKMLEVMNLV